MTDNYLNVPLYKFANMKKARIDTDEMLKIIGIGGCWFSEDSTRAYDTYEALRKHEIGPYRYLCSKEVKIEGPEKYEFFNPKTNRGYIIPGGCWYSEKNNLAFDTLEDCSEHFSDCQCICTEDYQKAFEIQGELPNLKSKVAKGRRRDTKGRFI